MFGDGFFLSLLGITIGILPLIDGAVRFTQAPPPILYVPNGGTAKFVWNYYVDDRNSEFFTTSPEWYYTNSNNKTMIAAEGWGFKNGIWQWIWYISPSCPARLKQRLNKESVATLVIFNVNTFDNGNYSCSLVLRGGKPPIESRAQLIVTVRPIFSINPPSSVVISETSNLGVPCAATGQPTPNLTWVRLRDQTTMSRGVGSATLNIPMIRRDQNGTYECRATNNPNESPLSSRTNVVVQYAPSITTRPKNITVAKGDQIALTCYASGNPSPTISWSKESGSIRPGHTTTGNTLVISNAVKGDAGKYICKASNFYEMATHTASATAHVTVKYEPTILSKSQDLIINETDPLHLFCKSDGYPEPNITWTKTPGSMTPSVSTGIEYDITSVKRSHAGTYTCTASNGIGREAAANIRVTVQYKAETDASKSTTVVESWNGKHTRLRCSFIGNPAPRVTWYKPSGSRITTLDEKENHNEDGTFSSETNITTTTQEDYGKYRCVVNNVVGGDEHYIMVNQLFTPNQPAQPHSISDSKGTQFTIFWCVPDVKGRTPVIDYKVEINTSPPREIISKNTFAEIKDLKENTQYKVKVYARNKAGYGDPVSRVILTENPENHTTFIIASLATILVISLVTNFLLIINTFKIQREERKLRITKRCRNTSYENKTDIEMESIPDREKHSSTDADIFSNALPSETSDEAVVDNASHYQSLSSATRRPNEARPPQLYEPLITKSEKPKKSEYASLQINNPSNSEVVEGKDSPQTKTETTVA